MAERIKPITERDKAQRIFKKAGRNGFVEDFIEAGCNDLKFMAMGDKDQKLWIKLTASFPSFLDIPPLMNS